MAGSDMEGERGRDAGIGGAGTDRKGAESSGNKASRDGGGSRSAATKTKMADLQSFGATPKEPSAQTVSDLGKAIDDYNNRTTGFGGFLNDFFGVKNKVAKNPNTGQWDVNIAKEINPTSTIAGLIGGPMVSGIVDIGMKIAGVKDPLGFEVDLGFASEVGPPKESKSQRDDRGFVSDVKGATNKSISAELEKQSPIDKAIKEIMDQQSTFKFFDMPAFKKLDTNFGTDIQALLKEKVNGNT